MMVANQELKILYFIYIYYSFNICLITGLGCTFVGESPHWTGDANVLLLILHSAIILGGSQRTLWDAGDPIWVGCIHGKYLIYSFISLNLSLVLFCFLDHFQFKRVTPDCTPWSHLWLFLDNCIQCRKGECRAWLYASQCLSYYTLALISG